MTPDEERMMATLVDEGYSDDEIVTAFKSRDASGHAYDPRQAGSMRPDVSSAPDENPSPPIKRQVRRLSSAPGEEGEAPPVGILDRLSAYGRRQVDQAKEFGSEMLAAGHAGYDVASDPALLADPAHRRELVRGVDNMVTLGMGQRIGNAGGRLVGSPPGDMMDATAAADHLAAPGMQALGGIAGSALPGAARLIGKGFSQIGPTTGGALARGAQGAVTGGASGAVVNKALGGEPTDALPIILGAVGGSARGTREAIRDPVNRTGRIVEDINRVGGKPNMLPGRPASGGMFDEPGYRALPEGDAGTMRMADEARRNITGNLEGRMHAARQGLDSAEAFTDQQMGSQPIDTSGALRKLDQIRREAIANNRALDPALDQVLRRYEMALVKTQTTPAGPVHSPEITFRELRNLTKQMHEAAGYGKDPSLRTSYGKRAAGVVSELQRGLTPELDQALEGYAVESEHAKGANDALIGKGVASPRQTATRVGAANSKLADVGRETKTALNRGGILEDALQPDYGDEIARLRARNAAESISFGMPNGGRPLATALRAIPQNMTALSVRAISPAARVTDAALFPPEVMALRESQQRAQLKKRESETQ